MELLEQKQDDLLRGLPKKRLPESTSLGALRISRPTINDKVSNITGPQGVGKGVILNPSVFDCESLLWTVICEGELESPESKPGKLAVILTVSPLSNTENFFLLNHPPLLESASVMR